jgi:hypothetical protein
VAKVLRVLLLEASNLVLSIKELVLVGLDLNVEVINLLLKVSEAVVEVVSLSD